MQDPTAIPTPLIVEREPVQIDAPVSHDPWRSLRILDFFIRSVGYWWLTAIQLLFQRRPDPRAFAIRVRKFMARMGGMWIKAAQLVALRRDIFLPETCDELAKLQDHAPGFPFEFVKAAIENELGGSIETLFSEFDPQPIAAASIGQTHVGRLRQGGARVAVKVQRPFVAKRLAQDMRYLRFLAACFEKLGVASNMRWSELIWELEHTLLDETDYRMEAASIRRMRKSLRPHNVYVPRVFDEYCGRSVLVLEFIEGVFMSDFIKVSRTDPELVRSWLETNAIDPKKVAERLVLSHCRQIFEDDIYHADLHPGNIVLQRNSHFALIDFGAVGFVERTQRLRYGMMFRSLTEHDYAKTVDMFLLMTPPLPNADMATLKLLLVRACRTWVSKTGVKGIPYHQKSLGAFLNALLEHLQKYQVPADWAFLRINRADHTLDASLGALDPDLEYPKVGQKYMRDAERRAVRSATRNANWVQSALRFHGAMQTWSENVYFDGEWMRKRAMDFQGGVGKVAYAIEALISGAGWLAALSVTALVLRHRRLGEGDAAWVNNLLRELDGWDRRDIAILALIAVVVVGGKIASVRRFAREKDFRNTGRGA